MGLLSTDAKEVLSNGNGTLAYLLELDLVPGAERYWTGIFDLSYDGATWYPTGGLGQISDVDSSADIRANGLGIEVHGLPVEEMRAGNLQASDYKGRAARFIFAVLQENEVVYAKPQYYYIDQLTYAISDGLGAVQVNLEHETTYAARESVRRFSDADQQREYPGDKGFEHVAYLSSGVEIRWGAAGSTFKD